jgi:mannose-1-phosphate guanylyltransferase
MRAMLVTAGFGTRLSPLTDLMPKPAVPVCNKPLAWYALDHLHRAGLTEFVLNTHHLADVLRAEMERHAPTTAKLSFVHESTILGTGGGIKNAWRAHRDEPLLTMNGKLLFAPDIAALVRTHQDSGAMATMVLQPIPEGASFGAIGIDADGRVRSILDDPPTENTNLRRMMFTGVQLLHPRAFDTLPENGCVIRDGYRHWLARGERIMAVVDSTPFRDAGITPWHYWEANVALLSGTLQWPGLPVTGTVIDPSAQIGEGAVIERSAVGAFASIAPGVRVEQCVVWPGCRVAQDTRDGIVLPTETLQIGARP